MPSAAAVERGTATSPIRLALATDGRAPAARAARNHKKHADAGDADGRPEGDGGEQTEEPGPRQRLAEAARIPKPRALGSVLGG